MLSTEATLTATSDVLTDRPILIAEAEAALAESIQYALHSEGLSAIIATDGEHALQRFRTEQPALVMLDLTLPKLSGMEVCRTLRMQSNVPIMVVTSRDSEADKVIALEVGADDYVTKPFSMRELVSRVRAHLRRSGMEVTAPSADLLVRGPVTMDVGRHEVSLHGNLVNLPPKEFKLLETLLEARGRLRTRASLIDDVWGPHYFGDTKTLDVHIKRIRHKIERDPHRPEFLLTVRGLGYRFLEDPGTASGTRRPAVVPDLSDPALKPASSR